MSFANWFWFQWHQFWLKYMRTQLQQWLFCASKLLTLAFPLCWAVLCYKSSQITDTTPWKTMEKELDGCHTMISELLHHTRHGLWHGCVLVYIWLFVCASVSCPILALLALSVPKVCLYLASQDGLEVMCVTDWLTDWLFSLTLLMWPLFSFTRRYRSDVSDSLTEWVIVRTDLTNVTLVSDDTYRRLY